MSGNGQLTTVQYDVKSLILADYNPRELTKDQHQNLKDSIVKFGFVDPLIVNIHKDRKNILVGGHQRLKIAKELKYKKVPCVEVELTPDREKELNIRLNKNTGQWDWDALSNNFEVGDLTEWGFSSDTLFDVENQVRDFGFKDPMASDDDYSTFDLVMLHENKMQLVDILNKIKADYELEKMEDAIMILVVEYKKIWNKRRENA